MYELKVEGMKCGGCAGRVTKAVQSVDRNARVDVELKSKTIRVHTHAALDAVRSAIAAAGYPAAESNAV